MTLEPCPFCGEQCAEIQVTQGMKWGSYVPGCLEVRTSYNMDDNAPWRDEAIAAWNTRAPLTAKLVGASGEANTDNKELVEQLRKDVEFLASLPLGLSMMQWCELSNRILEAADHILALEAEIARKDEALREIGDHNRFGWTLQTELARAALESKS